MTYEPKKIEEKWQKLWQEKKTFAVQPESEKKPWYSLVEFPYPSGAGMHVGHVRSYTALDVVSRKRRMEGYNVLYPMGWDAFGLPTENYAIKTGIAPQEATKSNTDNFRRQLQSLGYSFDWEREVNTTDPEYYKWTQWIFQQFFKHGLAYKAKMAINWCPKDKIGLANEEVVNGACERCGTAVEQRQKEQWMLKITAYADKLLEGLKDVEYLPEIKAQQENWIGRSEGAEIEFPIVGSKNKIKVFTTRPDTIFGATYLVVAPEHPGLTYALTNPEALLTNKDEVKSYVEAANKKNDLERVANDKEKTGIELKGLRVINPATQEEIPVWTSDYVLSSYGTGAIMAVPAHDERDFEFAKKFNLPVKQVIAEKVVVTGVAAPREGKELSRRVVVTGIIRNPKDDSFLLLRRTDKEVSFVGGSIDEGETPIESLRREIAEETGYTDIQIKEPGFPNFFGNGYKLRTDKNCLDFEHFYEVELASDKRQEVSPEEMAKHEPFWVSREQLSVSVTLTTHRHMLEAYLKRPKTYAEQGLLINSGKFDGMESEEAKKAITEFVGGKTTVKYKLRDWVFSRQRYWGEPIPLVSCGKCGWVCVPEKDLPVTLPKVEKYQPTDTGESPLSTMTDWVNVKCSQCGGEARRETDTMPNWAGSSWYYLAYLMGREGILKKASAENWQENSTVFKKFMPVNWYNGGMEHVTLHLLYSRFWNLFLFDQGLVPVQEPYKKRTAHGTVLAADGVKMSKSVGNVVNPDDLVQEFGADALRLYELFIGPFDQAVAWNQRGILGTWRFINNIWNYFEDWNRSYSNDAKTSEGKNLYSKEYWDLNLHKKIHQTIKKVGEDVEKANFNTAVSAMMILMNEIYKVGKTENGLTPIDLRQISIPQWRIILRILSPFAPHITEEINEKLPDHDGKMVCQQPWPVYDSALLVDDTIELVIQVNGKVRGKIAASKGITQEEAQKITLALPEIKRWVTTAPKKTIFVADRVINYIV